MAHAERLTAINPIAFPPADRMVTLVDALRCDAKKFLSQALGRSVGAYGGLAASMNDFGAHIYPCISTILRARFLLDVHPAVDEQLSSVAFGNKQGPGSGGSKQSISR